MILILTVGGSSQPLVSSIKQNKPDRLAFLCSDDTAGTKGSYVEVEGEGNICEKGTQPSIIIQANAEYIPREVMRIKDLDNPDACYRESLRLLTRLRQEYPEAQIIADYTGGTKSMSSGLVLAALDTKGVMLGVQAGVRANREKIAPNTQFTRLTHGHAPTIHRQRRAVADSFARFDCPSAISILQDILAIPDIAPETTGHLQKQLALARGLDAWDRFDHGMAWDLLSPLRAEFTDLVKFLEAVLWSRCKLDAEFGQAMSVKLSAKPKGHGYELVQDLVLNAERRADQGRYDDAVGRLYRALEILAQASLEFRYRIDTGDVALERMPAGMKDKFEQKRKQPGGKIQTGLREDYDLLDAFGDDPLGQVYSRHRGKLTDFLGIRNNSLYAHGFTPVTEKEYRKARGLLEPFFHDGTEAILRAKDAPKTYAKPVQFPQSIRKEE